jgi:putative ABC transport system substrate-binding protein
MAYSPDQIELRRSAATLVAKILGGARPGELPIERPTRFYFVINAKTAKALGLTLPPSIVVRADRVIE